MKTGTITIMAALATQVSAHMGMTWPPTLRGKENPFVGQNIDYSWTAPLAADGSNFPCKGELSLLGTEQGTPVVNYVAGQAYNITISGGAHHGGGSCQISLSYDQGQTFKAIKSIEGGCPVAGTSNLDFTIPADSPSGEATLSWSWFNRIGNREFYQSCSSVTIGGGSAKRSEGAAIPDQKRQTSFDSRPDMFVANVGNGCIVPEGIDVKFPSPGPDVENSGGDLGEPQGNCAAAVPDGSGAGSGSDASNPDGETSSPGTPAQTPLTSEEAPSATPTLPGAVFFTAPVAASPTTTADECEEPIQTTLATITKPSSAAPTEPTEPSVTKPSSGASAAPTEPASEVPSPSSGSGSDPNNAAGAQSGPCTNEGDWNCIAGTQYQRCAAGHWSVIQPVAPGTSCKAGVSDNLVLVKKLRFLRR